MQDFAPFSQLMIFIDVSLDLQEAPDSISSNLMASLQKLFAISDSYVESIPGTTCLVFIFRFMGDCALGEGGVCQTENSV